MATRKTIAVIGGGSAGLTAARTAQELGARVLFFMGDHADRASLCIEAGCMPSKALFEPIDAMHHAKRHGWLKIAPFRPEEYLAQIVAWTNREIAEFRNDRQEQTRRLASDRFRIIPQNAKFVSAHELEAASERYKIDNVILATGSTHSIPRELDAEIGINGVWTNDEILRNSALPKSLATIGAGPVAIELSLRYARLGCAVTMISREPMLSKFPRKFGERLRQIYEREGVRVLTGAKLVSVDRNRDGQFVLVVDTGSVAKTFTSERVLLATGRRPNLHTLNLAAAAVASNEEGKLEVGLDMRVCGSRHIFAAGDVAGQRMVVHQAHIEAGIAAENAVNDGGKTWDRRSNLQVVFSTPEFAFAGQSRETAERAGHKVATASAESKDVGKLHLEGDDLGFGEFVADRETSRLLGAGLLCNDASNLIHLPAYAIDHGHTVHQLVNGEFYHPTRIEIVSEIGDALCRSLGGAPFCRARE